MFITKIDVYVYDVILMEIIAGRMVIDEFLHEDDWYLVPIFRENVLDHEKVVDPTLEWILMSQTHLLEIANPIYHCIVLQPS